MQKYTVAIFGSHFYKNYYLTMKNKTNKFYNKNIINSNSQIKSLKARQLIVINNLNHIDPKINHNITHNLNHILQIFLNKQED